MALTPLARGATLLKQPLPRATLVLGGGASGKSEFAETMVLAALAPEARAVYLATAEAGDQEMAQRIQRHRDRRGERWETCHEPMELGFALARESRPHRPVLIDCLTLWLSNIMHAGRDPAAETAALLAVLPHLSGPVVFVSNEVGLGLIADHPLGRDFRDHAGRLHQAVAAATGRVVFVIAGLPLLLKEEAGRRA